MNTETNAVAKLEIPQYEMFPAIFTGDGRSALNIKTGEHGTSITMLKRSGKTESLAALSGLKGEALKAYERRQRDWLKIQMNQVVSAAMASAEYTGGSMRMGKNGSLAFRLAKVEQYKAPAITADSILTKFTSEELMELAEQAASLEAMAEAKRDAIENEAAPLVEPATETAPAAE